ncbi:PREDICTED: serine/threonine-protein phosphatase 7 long form homolog [Erythranthe guttata]|uniref:serine/threonine-protein phosphatase 7 long form homolog n=1 Tax=Erythranthe guttata TaxID=4155 RepID=UPI00064DE5BE|nr:PREDICTED: serine/threonine-protein phosphatase 7 long form homolog [Erythranthe guttata]|eukprot:XP_012840849.1 PREDICTED: serine/threonine-protein phosphatase 7 long form homolog [Erythranthe guttata]
MYYGTIQFMDIVEPYMPDRALRQFGRVQTIPFPIIESNLPHNRGLFGAGYKVTFHAPGGMWQNEYANFIDLSQYPEAWPPETVAEEYMKWYIERTHRLISNPDRVPPAERVVAAMPPDQPFANDIARFLVPIVFGLTGDDATEAFLSIQPQLRDLLTPHAHYLRLLPRRGRGGGPRTRGRGSRGGQ